MGLMMTNKIQIARLLNVTCDQDTGDVFLTMKVTDPVWRQKILKEWQDLDVSIVVKDKKEE